GSIPEGWEPTSLRTPSFAHKSRPMDIAVRFARPEELDDCIEIRRDVFVVGQNVPEALEVDGLDDSCLHVIARMGQHPVGTARLRITTDGHAKVERVAVREEARSQRIGHRLMDALEEEARRLGHQEVVLSAQVAVVGFYRSRGYAEEGPVYLDADIEHQTMRLKWPKP
ncbi:MAG: GNAT family N-acetyltransferase, partial [Myxococcota bacterium]